MRLVLFCDKPSCGYVGGSVAWAWVGAEVNPVLSLARVVGARCAWRYGYGAALRLRRSNGLLAFGSWVGSAAAGWWVLC